MSRVGTWVKKNLTIKGEAKKTFELNLSDCTWFSNWDEPSSSGMELGESGGLVT